MPLQIFAHRGLINVYPEQTLEAYRDSIAAGAINIETDCRLLADGALACMHDDTIDRTTSGTGNVVDQSSANWHRLVVDSSAFLGGGWGDFNPPTLDDILKEFANKTLLLPEAKVAGSGAPIVTKLLQYGVVPAQAIIQSAFPAELTPAIAAGYQTMLLIDSYTGTPAPAALVASGYTWIGVNGLVTTTAQMDALRLAGLKVAVYTFSTRADVAVFSPHADAIFSDDAIYQQGTARRTSDPFLTQTWYHGHIRGNLSADGNGRGAFYAPNMWGMRLTTNVFASCLMGWANPIGGADVCPAMTINFTIKFESEYTSSRWASLFVSTSDKPYSSDVSGSGLNGYHFLCIKDGSLTMYRVDNGVATLLDSKASGVTYVPDGLSGSYRITITPTTVKLERTDVAYGTLAIADATYRGANLHACAKGVFAKFSGITITTP